MATIVVGIDRFREFFAGEEERYALIGGAACSLIFDEVGLAFRATKDLDMVLCVEAVDGSFANKFTDFLAAGGYEARQRSTGEREFFRFHRPTDTSFPAMIELFARHPGVLTLPESVHLSPIDVENEELSLSAILLDPEYYDALLASRRIVDGISVLDERLLIPFKARAYVDLTEKGGKGDDINKHRLDVVRLLQLIPPGEKIDVPDKLKADIAAYIATVEKGGGLDPGSIGIKQEWSDVARALKSAYGL